MSDPKIPRPGPEDYARALKSMDTFMDITVSDLMTLAERAAHFAGQRVNESIRISRVMTAPVISVHPSTSMSEAAHLMVAKRISGLAVVDAADQLVGIVTEADFLRGLGLTAHHPTHSLWRTLESAFTHLGNHPELEGPDDAVSEHMTRDPVCVSPDQDVHDALELMKQRRIKRLLVCDDRRHVVGMVTRSDLIRLFFDRYRRIRAV